MKEAIYNDQAQLAGWSESNTSGAMIRLWLPDSKALEPFKALTARKGGTAGQVLALCVVVVGDDGKPEQQPEPVVEHEKPKGGPLAKLAGMWCAEQDFIDWLDDRYIQGLGMHQGWDPAKVIRHVCKIESRAELDHNPEARKLFDLHFRIPYQRHQEAQTR